MLGYYLILFFLVLLQSSVAVVLFCLPVVIYASQRQIDLKKAYVLGFVSGILTDLASGRTLGESAIFNLIAILFCALLNLRFQKGILVGVLVILLFEIVYFLLVVNFGF